jgi:hypothetical protein
MLLSTPIAYGCVHHNIVQSMQHTSSIYTNTLHIFTVEHGVKTGGVLLFGQSEKPKYSKILLLSPTVAPPYTRFPKKGDFVLTH